MTRFTEHIKNKLLRRHNAKEIYEKKSIKYAFNVDKYVSDV